METATRGRVGAAFMALELKLADAIKKAGADVEARVTNEGDEPGAFLLRCFVELSDVLLAGVKEALADTRSLLEERPVMVASWREEFESLVRGHATSTLDALLARLTHASGTGQSAAAAASVSFSFTPGAAFDPRRRARAAPPRLRAARQLHGDGRRAAHRARAPVLLPDILRGEPEPVRGGGGPG